MSEHWTDPIITEYPEFFPEKDDFMYSGPEHYAPYIKYICQTVRRLAPRIEDINKFELVVKELKEAGKKEEAQHYTLFNKLHRPLVVSRLESSCVDGILNHEYAPEGFVTFVFIQIKQKFSYACVYYAIDRLEYEDLSMHQKAIYNEQSYKAAQDALVTRITSTVKVCENLMCSFELKPLNLNL